VQEMECRRLYTTRMKKDNGGNRGGYFRGLDPKELDSC